MLIHPGYERGCEDVSRGESPATVHDPEISWYLGVRDKSLEPSSRIDRHLRVL